MSSVSAPFGFRASSHPSGLVRPKAYTIASGYAATIFAGDPVTLVAVGTITLSTSDGTRTGTTDGIKALGIFAGVEYRDSTGRPTVRNMWTGGNTATEITAWVYSDPETFFEVQYNNPGTPGTTSVQVDVGAECDWVVASPGGSTSTGLSNTLLTAIQSTSGNFQITGFQPYPGDSLTDAYVTAIVRINEHVYKAPVNGI